MASSTTGSRASAALRARTSTCSRSRCLYRRLLGEIARVAARSVTAAIRTLTGERDLAVGIVACLQTHGSRANWHPHLHLLVTDGGFRPDGTFITWPAHDAARLTEAFRRAVLRLFVRLELFDEDQAAGMLTWPHSGFLVHTAVWVPEDDRAFATRLARYCARNPVTLERLTYDRAAQAVTYRSDKSEGPTAGTETVDPLEFLARVLVHIPDKGHVTTRYYGWYANRPRGMRLKATPAAAGPPAIAPAPRLAPTEVARRWALLLQQIFEVDPLACPTCRGAMRGVAFITQSSVIDQILTHLRTRAVPARALRSTHSRLAPIEIPIPGVPVPLALDRHEVDGEARQHAILCEHPRDPRAILVQVGAVRRRRGKCAAEIDLPGVSTEQLIVRRDDAWMPERIDAALHGGRALHTAVHEALDDPVHQRELVRECLPVFAARHAPDVRWHRPCIHRTSASALSACTADAGTQSNENTAFPSPENPSSSLIIARRSDGSRRLRSASACAMSFASRRCS